MGREVASAYTADSYTYYFFDRNVQGDIVAVYNQSGAKIGTYTYDAWGNHTVTAASGISTQESQVLNTLNPFRYRGYFYDVETGLYYLQSRYYNPEWGRFISADDVSYLGANGDLQAFNLFAYCSNQPINYSDVSGEFIGALVGGAIGAVFGAVSGYISAVQSGDDVKMAVISGAISGAVIGALGAAVVDPISLALVSVASGVVAVTNNIVNQTYNYCKEQGDNSNMEGWADNMDWGSVTWSAASTMAGAALGGATAMMSNNAFTNVPSGLTKTIARDIVAGSHFSFITNGAQMVGDFFYSIVKG